MKKLIIILAFQCVGLLAHAQQDPLYSQYLNNPIVLNPAYAGIHDVFTASAGYRGQWSGLEGGPSTFFATGHISLIDMVGAGLTVIHDQIGVTTNTQVNASGAYKIDLGSGVFSFGLQAGINSYKEENNDLLIRDTDDALFAGNQQFTKFNFGAGAILLGDKYFVGLSVPRLANSKTEINNVENQVFTRHYYLGLGYVYELNTSLALKGSSLIKALKDAPASVDLSVQALFFDRFSGGIMTRNFNTYGLLLGAKLIDNLRFGYTFEIPTNQSVGSSFNTHELTLSLDIELLDSHNWRFHYF